MRSILFLVLATPVYCATLGLDLLFVHHRDGEVTLLDRRSGLEWSLAGDKGTAWTSSGEVCIEMGDRAGGGWRLPRVAELLAFCEEPVPAELIPAGTFLWSSELALDDPGSALLIELPHCTAVVRRVGEVHTVRCVRDR